MSRYQSDYGDNGEEYIEYEPGQEEFSEEPAEEEMSDDYEMHKDDEEGTTEYYNEIYDLQDYCENSVEEEQPYER